MRLFVKKGGKVLQEKQRRLMRFALITAGLVVLLFFLCPPDSLVYAWFWKPVIRRGTYIAIAICFALYFWKVRIDVFGLLAIAYWLVMMLSTLLMDASLWACARTYLPMVASMLLVRALFGTCKKQLLWAVLVLSVGYLVINLVGFLSFPEGTVFLHLTESSGFLGNRNGFPRFFLLAICSSAILDCIAFRKVSLRTAAVVVLCVTQAAVTPSATGSVALFLVIAGIPIVRWTAIGRHFNILGYAVAYAAVFFSVVVFRLQSFFAPLLTGGLGRDITFSGRTAIWDEIINRLSDPLHFFIGYCGNPDPILYYYYPITTGHNAVLDVMYNGGVVALAVSLVLCGLVGVNLYKYRSLSEPAIVSLFLGAFLVLGITEHIVCVPLCFFVAYGFCCGSSPGMDMPVAKAGAASQ